jgi:hypothetical protein
MKSAIKLSDFEARGPAYTQPLVPMGKLKMVLAILAVGAFGVFAYRKANRGAQR